MKKAIIQSIFLLLSILIFQSCSDSDVITITPIVVDFDIEISNTIAPSEITIVNKTTGATSYVWTFDGGSPNTSLLENPTAIFYENSGEYAITVKASNDQGEVKELTKIFILEDPLSSWGVYLTEDKIPFSNRFGMLSFVIDETAYMGGGTSTNSSSGANSDFYSLDINTNNFTKITDYPAGNITWGVAFSLGNFGYVGSGSIERIKSKDCYKYNTITKEWIKSIDFPGEGRTWGTAIVNNDKSYFGLGRSDSEYLKDFWVFEEGDSNWKELSSFPGEARRSASGFAAGNFIFIGGGLNSNFDQLEDFWKYDINTDSWIQLGALPEKIQSFSAHIVNDKGYIIGGNSDQTNSEALNTFNIQTTAINSVYQYDTDLDIWHKTIDFPELPRSNALSFVLNNKIHYGSSGFYSNEGVWINNNDLYVFIP